MINFIKSIFRINVPKIIKEKTFDNHVKDFVNELHNFFIDSIKRETKLLECNKLYKMISPIEFTLKGYPNSFSYNVKGIKRNYKNDVFLEVEGFIITENERISKNVVVDLISDNKLVKDMHWINIIHGIIANLRIINLTNQ